MLSWNRVTSLLLLLLPVLLTLTSFSQNTEMVQVGPPPIRRAEPPAPSASAEELEGRGDQLRAEKAYLDAMDYYEAAAQKTTISAGLLNKMGICDLMLQRYKEARKNFNRAVKTDRNHADAYSNLGAAYFGKKQFDKAAISYSKALELDPDVFERISRAGVQAQLPSPQDRARYDYVLAKLYAQRGIADRSLH